MSPHVIELLNRYSKIVQNEKPESKYTQINFLNELITKYTPYLVQLKESERLQTPYYNVFDILRIRFLEAAVHTPFLANLLNINGSHSQDKLFFDKFLKLITQEKDRNIISYNPNFLYLKTEHKTPNGIIDILIYHRPPRKTDRYVIIIENKVYAPDQQNQIYRYYKYAREILGLSDPQIIIVYLKPYKQLPPEYSISSKYRNHLIQTSVLKILGYKPDIKEWLLSCNDCINSEKLKQTIIQYIDNLNTFPYEEIEQGHL